MADDIAAVRAVLSEHVTERNEEVILVLHSAGGFIGSAAMEGGLSRPAREQVDLAGGVTKTIFISGAVFPEGHKHHLLPFAISKHGAAHPINPEFLLFDDVPEAEKAQWRAKLQSQPTDGWDGAVSYAGWKEVPSVYLVCEGDRALPVPLQEQLAALAGSRVERCSAGHMPHVSQPQRVAGVSGGDLGNSLDSLRG